MLHQSPSDLRPISIATGRRPFLWSAPRRTFPEFADPALTSIKSHMAGGLIAQTQPKGCGTTSGQPFARPPSRTLSTAGLTSAFLDADQSRWWRARISSPSYSAKREGMMGFPLARAALVAVQAGVNLSAAVADSIVPDAISYTYNRDETDDAQICEITLDMQNPATPELVEFTAFAGYDKSNESIAIGFIMMAAHQPLSEELQLLDLSAATFTSPIFRSVDHMDYEVHKDGGIMAATLDRVVARDFLQAFVGGDFELTLATAGSGSTWSYKISAAPPTEVQNSFARCLEELLRPSVSLLNEAGGPIAL
jgi:hypothetical protein